MNFGNLQTLARTYIPGAKNTAIDDATLKIILNEGVLDVASRTKALKHFDYFNAEADVASYRLSQKLDYFLGVDESGVWIKNGTTYQEMDAEDMKSMDNKFQNWRADEGSLANRYIIHGDLFMPHPIVNVNISNGFLIYYYERPQTMVEDADFPFHVHGTKTVERSDLAILSDLVLLYTEWKLLKVMSKRDDAYAKLNEYLEEIKNVMPRINYRADIAAFRKTKMAGPRIGK